MILMKHDVRQIFFASVLLSTGLIISSMFFITQTNAETVTTSVTVIRCGNSVIESGEQCDDGNAVSGDGCSSSCQLEGPVCGNGVREDTEQCDDGNGISGDGCSAACVVEGKRKGVYIPPPVVKTKVIAIGKAYPLSEVTLLIDGAHSKDIIADNFGNFRFEVEDISAGTFTFGFFAKDSIGRRSITFNFTTSITPYTVTTIGGILLPPTIELSKPKANSRDIITLEGSSAPSSKITIEISKGNQKMIQSVKADVNGVYEYGIFTRLLGIGAYQVKVRAESESNLISIYTESLNFEILADDEFKKIDEEKKKPDTKLDDDKKRPDIKPLVCLPADFNCDSLVNLIDLSIMLHYWKTSEPMPDLNEDGITDIFDFSILIYWWTG